MLPILLHYENNLSDPIPQITINQFYSTTQSSGSRIKKLERIYYAFAKNTAIYISCIEPFRDNCNCHVHPVAKINHQAKYFSQLPALAAKKCGKLSE